MNRISSPIVVLSVAMLALAGAARAQSDPLSSPLFDKNLALTIVAPAEGIFLRMDGSNQPGKVWLAGASEAKPDTVVLFQPCPPPADTQSVAVKYKELMRDNDHTDCPGHKPIREAWVSYFDRQGNGYIPGPPGDGGGDAMAFADKSFDPTKFWSVSSEDELGANCARIAPSIAKWLADQQALSAGQIMAPDPNGDLKVLSLFGNPLDVTIAAPPDASACAAVKPFYAIDLGKVDLPDWANRDVDLIGVYTPGALPQG